MPNVRMIWKGMMGLARVMSRMVGTGEMRGTMIRLRPARGVGQSMAKAVPPTVSHRYHSPHHRRNEYDKKTGSTAAPSAKASGQSGSAGGRSSGKKAGKSMWMR
jgi:hypothetical protein